MPTPRVAPAAPTGPADKCSMDLVPAAPPSIMREAIAQGQGQAPGIAREASAQETNAAAPPNEPEVSPWRRTLSRRPKLGGLQSILGCNTARARPNV